MTPKLDAIIAHGGELDGPAPDAVGGVPCRFTFPTHKAAAECARALHRFLARGAVVRAGGDLFVIVTDEWPIRHEHRTGGQVLRHAHIGGHLDHGYYGHPEDAARPDLVRIARDVDCPGCGFPETVAVGRLLVGADLYQCNARPPCGWRTDTVEAAPSLAAGLLSDALDQARQGYPVDVDALADDLQGGA